MTEAEAILKHGTYMNVNEGKMYIGIYRYPPSYPISPTLLFKVTWFLRYCDICIDDCHF